jgi:hypothetical protein
MAERVQHQENKDIWNSRLAKAGAVLIAAGLALSALKIPGAEPAFQAGLIAFTGGFAWNWAFGKGKA